MVKYTEANYSELLGVTAVCQISDREIWERLLSPITRGLLGPIVERRDPLVKDTVSGLFAGDEVTNLNGHRLYAGSPDFVRFPYVYNFYRTANGALIIKRDGLKFEAIGWFGDVEAGRGEVIFKAGLRDRRFDSTKRANDCALLEFPYDHPVYDRPPSPVLRSVELSIYTFMPGSRIRDMVDDSDYDEFVRQPFKFRSEPEKFLKYFGMVWSSRRAPGQNSAPVTDVADSFLRQCESLALKYGYDLIEMAPSHYHVLRWGLGKGYSFVDPAHAAFVGDVNAGLQRIRDAGHPLTRSQQSWVCVAQSLPAESVPTHLALPGLIWPQDNIGPECLWLYKPLSRRASDFKPVGFDRVALNQKAG